MATKSAPPTNAKSARKPAPTLAGNAQHHNDTARKNTLEHYESALKLMQAGKYEKAHESFLKMLDSAPPDFAERIRMYIAACVAQLGKTTHDFQSHEERYDYAISLLNDGNYEDAREHLEAILSERADADYAFYGLAILASMTGQSDVCIHHLAEAIRLNMQNRFQARLDSDFANVADDPRFTELLYPEV